MPASLWGSPPPGEVGGRIAVASTPMSQMGKQRQLSGQRGRGQGRRAGGGHTGERSDLSVPGLDPGAGRAASSGAPGRPSPAPSRLPEAALLTPPSSLCFQPPVSCDSDPRLPLISTLVLTSGAPGTQDNPHLKSLSLIPPAKSLGPWKGAQSIHPLRGLGPDGVRRGGSGKALASGDL